MADSHAPKEMAVHCPQCDSVGVSSPRGFLTYYEPHEGPPERWTLLSCPQGHPLLVLQNQYSGDITFDEDKPYRMYPPQDRRLSDLVPSELRESHDATQSPSTQFTDLLSRQVTTPASPVRRSGGRFREWCMCAQGHHKPHAGPRWGGDVPWRATVAPRVTPARRSPIACRSRLAKLSWPRRRRGQNLRGRPSPIMASVARTDHPVTWWASRPAPRQAVGRRGHR
jgi:hypothetical protein